MKKAMSIRTYLILFCVGIVLVSMLCQVTFNVFFARSLSIQQAKNRIETLYSRLVEGYSDDPEVINGIVETALADENIKVMVFNDQGGIIFDGAPMQSTPRATVGGFQVSNVYEYADTGVLIEYTPNMMPAPQAETDQTTVRLVEVFEYNGSQRIVVMWSSVVAIESSVVLFTQSNIIVSAAVLLLGILGVFIFSKRFIRPIDEIEVVARRMADMNFDQQADENTYAVELQSLARSVNTMSDKLSDMIDSLSADNASLTSQVEYQEKMEQMRRQFIANISHEMKTPLSMLMMYSESLRSNVPGIDRNYYCDTIIEEAAGLNTMVGQLLDISSIENGLSRLDPQVLNFSDLVQSVLSKMGILLSERTLTSQIDEDIVLSGDRKYLEQAMTNYLSNAVSHTKPDGNIRVSLGKLEGVARFTVWNDGDPVAEEDIPRLWESFYRADKSRTQHGQKRVGLGLYIVKTIVNAHSGAVMVENTGDGVAFSFDIPMIDS